MNKNIPHPKNKVTAGICLKQNRSISLFLTKKYSLICLILLLGFSGHAQNSKIKVYFNHAVNSNVSIGVVPYFTQYFEDTIAALINYAKYSVDIAQYDYTASSGSGLAAIATACNNAAARGVMVRWIHDGNAPNSGLSLLSSSVAVLGSPTTGMQTGYIMHNKFVVIDCNSSNPADAFISTSSFDWSSEMASSDYNNMVTIQDQTLAKAYDSQFNQMWGGSGPAPVPANEKFSLSKTASPVNSFTVNGTPIQVYFSPTDGASNQLINVVNSANYELYFGIYEFTTTNVASAMQNKYTSGISGFGIEDQFAKTASPYTTLSASSVLGTARLKVYSGSYIYHNKMICADPNHPGSDPQVGCGSYNWTSTASVVSDENFMVIHDVYVANQYYQSLCADFSSLGGAACTSYAGVETYDLGSQAVAVYPNPFTDQVKVSLKNAGETIHVLVYDQLGKLLYEKTVQQQDELDLDLSGLSAGIYFINVYSGNNQYVQKLIK